MKSIFVSSTFKDMHFERDALEDISLPLINKIAKEYGDVCSFCDLRWGINTLSMDENESNKKVVEVCLDVIDHSSPPMVVLIGNRYGWVLDKSLIEYIATKKNIIIDDYEKSITALEIEYGSIIKQNNTLFYFRNIENEIPKQYLDDDPIFKEKLNKLKEKIYKITNGKVKEYTLKWENNHFAGIDNFANMVANDVIDILKPNWENSKKRNILDNELYNQLNFFKEKASIAFLRKDIIDSIILNLENQNNQVISLKGDSGLGKTTILSKIGELYENKNYNVLKITWGLSQQSNDSLDILRLIAYFLKKELNIIEDYNKKDETNKARYLELLSEYDLKDKKTIIIIDAIDQLQDDEEKEKLTFIPFREYKNIKFLISSTTSYNYPSFNEIIIDVLTDLEIKDIIKYNLQYFKEISNEVINKIIKKKNSNNPLYLSLVLKRLMMFNYDDFLNIYKLGDGINGINNYMLNVVNECPEDLNEMTYYLLKCISNRIGFSFVDEFFKLFSITKNGLREYDLKIIMKDNYNPYTFQHLISYLSDAFVIFDDGTINFTHKHYRQCFDKIYLNENEFSNIFISYLKTLDNNDNYKIKEYPYHLIKQELTNDLLIYVNSIKDNHKAITYVINELYLKCLEDNGNYLLSIFNNVNINDSFVNIVLKQLPLYIKNDSKEYKMFTNLFLEIFNIIENDERFNKYLIVICSSLSVVLLKIGDDSSLEKIISFINKITNNSKINDELSFYYINALENLAESYIRHSNVENIKKGIYYYEVLNGMLDDSSDYTKLKKAHILTNLFLIYKDFYGDLSKVTLNESALKILESFDKDTINSSYYNKYLENYSLALQAQADYYFAKNTIDDDIISEKYFNKAKIYTEELIALEHKNVFYRDLAVINQKLGLITLRSKKDYPLAFTLYEKSLKVFEKIYNNTLGIYDGFDVVTAKILLYERYYIEKQYDKLIGKYKELIDFCEHLLNKNNNLYNLMHYHVILSNYVNMLKSYYVDYNIDVIINSKKLFDNKKHIYNSIKSKDHLKDLVIITNELLLYCKKYSSYISFEYVMEYLDEMIYLIKDVEHNYPKDISQSMIQEMSYTIIDTLTAFNQTTNKKYQSTYNDFMKNR